MNHPLSVSSYSGDDYSLLVCPLCGDNYLHHADVAVFDRRVEDDTEILLSVVRSGAAVMSKVQSAGSGNPSKRRHGLRIAFTCELCPQRALTLCVAQHKGLTLVWWDVQP